MNRIALCLIRWYQRTVSPYKGGPCCKYRPTCSQYALEAFQRFGFFKAFGLTVWRLLRCNPFSKGGYDPVPDDPKKNI